MDSPSNSKLEQIHNSILCQDEFKNAIHSEHTGAWNHGLVKGVLTYRVDFNFIQDIYGVRRSLASFDRKRFNVLSYRTLIVLVEGFPIQISDNEMQFVPFWLIAITVIFLGSFVVLTIIVVQRSRHMAKNSGTVSRHADHARDYVSHSSFISMPYVIHLTFSNAYDGS